MKIFGMDVSASEITAVCALVVSAASLAVSVASLWANRHHQRLSVAPHLDEWTHKLMTNEGFVWSYEISNNGIGPAKIKSFDFVRSGNPIPRATDSLKEYTDMVIHDVLGSTLKYQIKHTSIFGNDSSLKVGDTHRIFEVLFPDIKTEEQKLVFLKNLKKEIEDIKLKLVIKYESFYGKKFVFDSDRDKF